jgi:hypothetical protein
LGDYGIIDGRIAGDFVFVCDVRATSSTTGNHAIVFA